MTTDGGGWMLGVNSVLGSEPETTDMASNTGIVDFNQGHTRDLSYWAINQTAEIRHQIIQSPISSEVFDAKYTGAYHDPLPADFSFWTPVGGHTPAGETLLSYHFGMQWTTFDNDKDLNASGNCSTIYGNIPWYYKACYSVIPTYANDGFTQGPSQGVANPFQRYSIWVRELVTPDDSSRAGQLDPTFNGSGMATTAPAVSSEVNRGIAILSDGRILAGGSTYDGADYEFFLASFNTNGIPDNTFGIGGEVQTDFGIGFDLAEGMTLQNDGKILLVGRTADGTQYVTGSARYNPDGTLDAGYGSGGLVTTQVSGLYESAHDTIVQSDGKIILAGTYRGGSYGVSLIRYNPNGTLDNGFGNNGIVTSDLTSADDSAQAVALQSDGKIVIAGYAKPNFLIGRYTSDGVLDTTFGTSGLVITPALGPSTNQWNDVVIQPDGKILVAGFTYFNDTFSDIVLARFNSDGTPDSGFNSTGLLTFAINPGQVNDFASGLALQLDGKILVAGNTVPPATGSVAFLTRLNPDGSYDTSFDGDGIFTASQESGFTAAIGIATQADGRIVVSGQNGNAVMVARLFAGLHGKIDINGGTTATADPSVTLELTCLNDGNPCTEMQFSDDGVTWLGWEPFWPSKDYALSPGMGVKTVYVQFRDGTGAVSDASVDTIELQPVCPELQNVAVGINPDNGNAVINWDAPAASDASVCIDVLDPQGTFLFTECTASSCYDNYVCYDYYDSWGFYLYTDCFWQTTCTPPTSHELMTSFDNQFTVYYSSGTCADNPPVSPTPPPVLDPARTLNVPATSSTGNFYLSWNRNYTADASYVLEVDDGSGFVEVYRGTNPGFSATGLGNGSYSYRVRTSAPGYLDSPWTTAVPVTVQLTCAAPMRVYASAVSSSGSFTLSWNISPTPGASYLVEVDNGSGFAGATATSVNYLQVSGLASGTYTYRVKTTAPGYLDSGWTSGAPVDVQMTCSAPTRLYAPSSSSNGSAYLNWSRSTTPGATYVLEVDSGSGFAEVYRGSLNYRTVSGLASGSHTFRVKAIAGGYADSNWTTGSKVDVALSCGAPLRLYVPASSLSGSAYLSWSRSYLPGATYVLEVDSGGGFAEVYRGSQNYRTVSGLAGGSHNFRVKTVAAGYADSAWTTGATLDVQLTCGTPMRLYAPAGSSSGSFNLNWSYSYTPGVSYVVEVDDGSGYTEIYRGPNRSLWVSGLASGSYDYRVKAIANGYADSAWRDAYLTTVVSLP